MEKKHFQAGEVIVRQGDWEMCMYDILFGKIGIYVDYELPTQRLLTELKNEDFFGEMGLLESMPRSASAVALEECAVYVITADNFANYFKERPATVLDIMEHMSARLRALTQDYMDACRTVAEAVEAESSGKEKSGWLKTHLKRFSETYWELQAGLIETAGQENAQH